MVRIIVFLILFFIINTQIHSLYAQEQAAFGVVRDAVSGSPLPAATVRIVGTSKGTVTNARGEFRIPFSVSASVTISYVGYRSDTLTLVGTSSVPLLVRLQPSSIQLPGVTVTDEDPAYEIIRRAIAEKQRWMQRLNTFEGKAFTRMALRRDTSIASITEAYSTLYWSRTDSLREVITQTRKTGNLPGGFKPSNVGQVINLNDDEIRQLGFRFVGPTSPDAFDYYNYQLLRTRVQDDFEVYDIQLVPRSRTTPLFAGRISIAERSYAVMEVDVRPNEAFVLPFIRVNDLRYIQHFRMYESQYWLPTDYRTTCGFTVSVAGITLPAIGIEKDVVIYDYEINPDIADSIHAMPAVSFDSSSTRFDSTFWYQTNVLPLTTEQQTAYTTLDSTQTLEEQFKPKGAVASLLEASSNGLLSVVDIHFNRAEGAFIGADKSFGDIVDGVDVRTALGYGFSDSVWKYGAGATYRFGPIVQSSASSGIANAILSTRRFSFGADIYRTLNMLPEEKSYSLLSNSIAALVSRLDYYDYYEAEGWKTMFTFQAAPLLTSAVEYRSEKNNSVTQHTWYSLFSRDARYRLLPPIDDGQLRAVTASVSYGNRVLMNFVPQGMAMNAGVEYSDARNLKSDFSYARYRFSSFSKIMTMGSDLLYPQSVTVITSLGASTGSLPKQREFDVVAGMGGYTQIGALRGVRSREFYGNWMYTVTAEYNFRRTPFLWLGIGPLYETNWEFIVVGSVARTPNSNGIYSEVGCGINNIFDLLRIDLTYRLAAPRGIILSLSLADFLSGV